jgi:hypothetical protein
MHASISGYHAPGTRSLTQHIVLEDESEVVSVECEFELEPHEDAGRAGYRTSSGTFFGLQEMAGAMLRAIVSSTAAL